MIKTFIGLTTKHADCRIVLILKPIRLERLTIFLTDQKNQPYLQFFNIYCYGR